MEFDPDWVSLPGTTIRAIMATKKITLVSLARATGLPSQKLSKIIKGIDPIQKAHAHAFARVLGASPSFWLRREEQYTEGLVKLGLKRGQEGGPKRH